MTTSPFFVLAMLSPSRQRSFRRAVVLHVAIVAPIAAAIAQTPRVLPVASQLLLIAGIVEGAILVGWRLTQIPKSQALEFLLVSPVQPRQVFVGEALVALSRFALIGLSGLPLLVLLAAFGRISIEDVAVLVVMPLIWGAVSGLGIAVWAYESRSVRRVCEWAGFTGVLVYLLVGVLAGEKLALWIGWLPENVRWWVMETYGAAHRYNPFAVTQFWFESRNSGGLAFEQLAGVALTGVSLVALLMMRGAARLRGHFRDRHYRPLTKSGPRDSAGPGDRPLAWWAVRRVMEYSGRINIWLAGGFGVLYAAYTLAGDRWPPWLGRLVFQLVESTGGVPVVITALVVLAAVPACFQYGLWDSSAQDRARRLELLLLTDLDGRDYWFASAAAAWRRGRGYLFIAGLLWLAALASGKLSIAQTAASIAAGVLLWSLYFALGFWSFARGRQANGLGTLLTLGVPVGCIVLSMSGSKATAAALPPGWVWYPLAVSPDSSWLWAPALFGLATLALAVSMRRHCTRDLRNWYSTNHGRQGVD